MLDLLGEKVLLYAESTRAVSLSAGWEQDYLSQILRANVSLKASHLYTVLDVLGIAAEDFFAELHLPGRRLDRLARLLREVVVREDGGGASGPRDASNTTVARKPNLSPGLQARVGRFARLVRRTVRFRGFSLSRASRRMGRPSAYLSRLLAGEPDISLEKVYALLQAIEVSPATLFAALHPLGSGRSGGRGFDSEGSAQGLRLTHGELRQEVQRAVRDALAELARPED